MARGGRSAMSQEERDFNKSKRDLVDVLEVVKIASLDMDGRNQIKSAMEDATKQIEPRIANNLVMDLSNLGSRKRKQLQAFLDGKATISMKK